MMTTLTTTTTKTRLDDVLRRQRRALLANFIAACGLVGGLWASASALIGA